MSIAAACLCVLVPVRGPLPLRRPRRRWAASRRAAGSAAPRPSCSSAAAGWPTPRKSSSITPGFTRHEARGRQRQPGQGDGQDRRRLPARRARRPRPHRHRHQRAAHVLGRRLARSSTRRSRTATSPAAEDPAQRHRPRRRRQRGRRLLRRRGEEGPALQAEIEGDAAGRTRCSTPTSPSSTASASSWPPPTTRRCSGRTASCSIVAPADGTYIVQVRESAYGGNGACQYRLHVGTFPRPTAVVPAGGKPGEEVEVRSSATRPARSSRRSSCRRRAGREVRRLRPGRGRHLALGRSRSACRELRQRRSRSSRTTRHATATQGRAARGASTASSTSRATSTTSASRRRRARRSTSTATPAGSARRSTRS